MVKCDLCPFEAKNASGASMHRAKKHAETLISAAASAIEDLGVTLPVLKPVEAGFTPKKDDSVSFTSPKALYQTIIVVPDQWKEVTTPVGGKLVQVPGKTVQFEAGLYRTSDLEIIDYLENKYDDPRRPIFSSRQMHAMVAR